jgi:hypothetical protein
MGFACLPLAAYVLFLANRSTESRLPHWRRHGLRRGSPLKQPLPAVAALNAYRSRDRRKRLVWVIS